MRNPLEKQDIGNFAINQGLSWARQATQLLLWGRPRDVMTDECQPITNHAISRLIVTESVGPFRVTGLIYAVQSLRQVFSEIKATYPDYYDNIASAGMLCCRLVRGSQTNISNHSWGTAIDLRFFGELVPLGSRNIPIGMVDIAAIFNRYGWFWGAGFSRCDPMHFEIAEETLLNWGKQYKTGSISDPIIPSTPSKPSIASIASVASTATIANITSTPIETYLTTATSQNVRSGPGTDFQIIGSITSKNALHYRGETVNSFGYFDVIAGGIKSYSGWVGMSYLAKVRG